MDIRVYTICTNLADGSEVYDVHIGDTVKLHAVSLNDASELVDKIRMAINQHALETVHISPF